MDIDQEMKKKKERHYLTASGCFTLSGSEAIKCDKHIIIEGVTDAFDE